MFRGFTLLVGQNKRFGDVAYRNRQCNNAIKMQKEAFPLRSVDVLCVCLISIWFKLCVWTCLPVKKSSRCLQHTVQTDFELVTTIFPDLFSLNCAI